MGIWKQVASQVGGMLQGTARKIVQEPLEVGQSAVQQVTGDQGSADNQAQAMLEQATAPTTNGGGSAPGDNVNGGFRTPADLQRYEQLSGRKDEIELNQIRANLVGQFGLETAIAPGMQRASAEYQQKEAERKKVVEEKKQQEEWVVEKKKKDDIDIKAAQAQGGAEIKAWGAG